MPSEGEQLMALLALSHTPTEHEIYEAMLAETKDGRRRAGVFSLRRLMELTGLASYSAVRRSLAGLLRKLSIERSEEGKGTVSATFQIFLPEEIFRRRVSSGIAPYPKEAQGFERSSSYRQAIRRVTEKSDLTRREAQVALLCARGLTNAQIGERLDVTEQTIKFHLRHVYIKFGVRRRAELISHLLLQFDLEDGGGAQPA